MRAAVIGAGPSGFYATDQLLAAEFSVDLYDALPTPYGLVRAGVAPDHPKIKSVSRVFEKTARHESEPSGLCLAARSRPTAAAQSLRWAGAPGALTRAGTFPRAGAAGAASWPRPPRCAWS